MSGSAAVVPLDGAWLVGGSVRDLLVGRPVADIDVMVDGDRGLGRPRSGVPGGRLAVSAVGAPRCLAGGAGVRTIDIARTRGTVEEDLGLRDFTINAMALPLAGGDLVDPHGGRARTWTPGSCGRSATGSSTTTRCGCCAWLGSPGSWGS